MSNWILKASSDWLTPVFKTMHTELLKQDILHADETTFQVLHEPGKSAQSKSYMCTSVIIVPLKTLPLAKAFRIL